MVLESISVCVCSNEMRLYYANTINHKHQRFKDFYTACLADMELLLNCFYVSKFISKHNALLVIHNQIDNQSCETPIHHHKAD